MSHQQKYAGLRRHNKIEIQGNQHFVKWRDVEKIKEIYSTAKQLTEETGIRHEVDHIIPVHSKKICGLHVHQNLQVVKIGQNRQKSNKFIAE